jgi:hypothetical protein
VRPFTSVYVYTAYFGHRTEITLQGVPNREYTLRLFIENLESELQSKDNHTWAPARRQYVPYFPNTYTQEWLCVYRDVSPTSQMRAEIRMKHGHAFWATYRETGDIIDLQGLFNHYWGSDSHEFTVLSQLLSPTSPHLLTEG